MAPETRDGPRGAERRVKEQAPILCVIAALQESEVGSGGAPSSLRVSSALVSHGTIVLQKRGNRLKLYLYRDATTPCGESSYNLYIYMHIYIFFKSLPERTIESYQEKKNKGPCETFPATTQLGDSVSWVEK